jgi:hypothetical protein
MDQKEYVEEKQTDTEQVSDDEKQQQTGACGQPQKIWKLNSLIVSQNHPTLVYPLVLLVQDQPDEREGSDNDGTGHQGCDLGVET